MINIIWMTLLCTCTLVIWTRADGTDTGLQRCQNYKNDIATKCNRKTSKCVIYWSDEIFVADLQTGLPEGQVAYEVKFLQRMPFIGTHLIFDGTLDTSLFQGDFWRISFEYDPTQTNDELLIKVDFVSKASSKHLYVIQVLVLENDDPEVRLNYKLYEYLNHISSQQTTRVNHNLSWLKETLQNFDDSAKKLYKNREKNEKKLDFFYTNCQYVPRGTLRNFARRFGWITEN